MYNYVLVDFICFRKIMCFVSSQETSPVKSNGLDKHDADMQIHADDDDFEQTLQQIDTDTRQPSKGVGIRLKYLF